MAFGAGYALASDRLLVCGWRRAEFTRDAESVQTLVYRGTPW